MALLDKLTEFCDAVSVAGSAGTALVGSQVDLSVARDLGNLGEALYFMITVDTEIITGGSAGTIIFKLSSDATAAIATDGTATDHIVSKTYVTDDSAANDSQMNAGGIPVCVKLPLEGPVYEQFLGVLVVIGTTTVTAGKINAFFTTNPQAWKAYPNAI